MKNREPRTTEAYKELFSRDAQRRPGWKVLPLEILVSEPFLQLRTKGAQLVLLYAFSQISYEKKGKRSGKRRQVVNDTVFLPTNALQALGITSSATRTKIRNELVEKGFLDVVKTGSYLNPAIFKVSDRWRRYPHEDYRPNSDQPRPGLCMGHRFPKRNPHDDVCENSFPRSGDERRSSSSDERKLVVNSADLLRSTPERNSVNGIRSAHERST
jgi:hypothetical protein